LRTRTAITAEEFDEALSKVCLLLAERGSINNATLRDEFQFSSDQGISFFRRAVAEGLLVRRGKGVATRYEAGPTLPSRSDDGRPR
jgi:hypothetical protein